MTTDSSLPVDTLLKGARILVVEDEWMISELIVEFVREWGCEIIGPATHVAMAVGLASIEKIDCALLDLNLVGEAVYPAAKTLSDRKIPFAFITGYGKAGISESFRERPMLQKPFSAEKLGQILRDMLSLSVK